MNDVGKKERPFVWFSVLVQVNAPHLSRKRLGEKDTWEMNDTPEATEKAQVKSTEEEGENQTTTEQNR